MLLDDGADPDQTDDIAVTVLEYSLQYHPLEILFNIRNSCCRVPNWTDSEGDSRLMSWLQNSQQVSDGRGNVFIFNFCLLLSGIRSLECLNKKRINEIAVQFHWLCIDLRDNLPATRENHESEEKMREGVKTGGCHASSHFIPINVSRSAI